MLASQCYVKLRYLIQMPLIFNAPVNYKLGNTDWPGKTMHEGGLVSLNLTENCPKCFKHNVAERACNFAIISMCIYHPFLTKINHMTLQLSKSIYVAIYWIYLSSGLM